MRAGLVAVAVLIFAGLSGCISNPDGTLNTANVDAVQPATGAVVAHMARHPGADLIAPANDASAGFAARFTTIGHGATEPTLGVTPEGTLFYAAADGATAIFRSQDQGATWTDVSPKVAGTTVPPITFDPYVHVDADTGRVFSIDLEALACAVLSFSDDDGESWTTNPLGCGHPVGGQDHQTITTGKPTTLVTAGYPNVVYYCINRLVDSACASSLNGGLSFGPLVPVWPATETCSGLHGHAATGPDGTVYVPKAQCDSMQVAFSTDNGLSWTRTVVSGTVKAASNNDPSLSVDEEGNVHVTWIGEDGRLYLASSTDGGATFGDAFDVTPPGVATAQLPSLAAGAGGKLALVYYGTDVESQHKGGEDTTLWNAYMTIIPDALAPNPTLVTMRLNDADAPVLKGGCSGGRCPGVLDFIDVVIDVEGRPWAAFTDAVTNDRQGMVATLATGATLRGTGMLEALPLA